MLEYIIVGLIVGAVCFATGRYLWRTWTGRNTEGCSGCTGCSSSFQGCGAKGLCTSCQGGGGDSTKSSRKEADSIFRLGKARK